MRSSRKSRKFGQSVASLERPGIGWVRELVGAGRVSTVLAQDRDRVAHESASLFYLREEFGQHGRELRALNDRGDDNPEGQLTDGILDQIARFERLKIAEGSRQRKLRKARGKAPVWDLIFSLLKDPDRLRLALKELLPVL
jgi:DNA invertase Pin-like site-specific DNA recombinase